MKLIDLVNREKPPTPWTGGDKIPWNELEFSERMLAEHLSQAHDAASRRIEIIEQQVEWLHQSVLGGRATKVLDLGCGPGLYTQRLAQLGHTCVGIDFSPASIRYAQEKAANENLTCEYFKADVRTAEYGNGYGLVMMIHGELNTFNPKDTQNILNKGWETLRPGGRLVVEIHPLSAIQAIGERKAGWYSADEGLFSTNPHLFLRENFWYVDQQTATERIFVVDAASGETEQYSTTMQGYQDNDFTQLLEDVGFEDVKKHPALIGDDAEEDGNYVVFSARKRTGA